jgi:hypothetical protein
MTTPPPGNKRPRDASSWAVSRNVLRVSEVPEQAVNLNVEGRRVAGALQGFGQLWQKTYKVRLAGAEATPKEVVRIWKDEFPDFHPPQSRFYPPLGGVAPGEIMLINASVQGMPVYTGVMVLYADEESFTLMTPQGHMFAGWITFSATEQHGQTVAQAQVLMRASDPIFEMGLTMGGHKQEDRFWNHTLSAVAAHFGEPEAEVATQVVCVDKKRQWSRWRNVWHSSAIRSTLYMLGAPVRGARRLAGRP